MSDFLTNFRSLFTEEERKSELYRILATIGVNTEKSILEELNAEIRRSTEASAFPENKLRSWLAFFNSPVRNAVSASGFGHVVMNSVDGGSQSFATIPAGSVVSGSNGKEYQIQNALSLFLGCSTPFSFVQGKEVEYTGVYNDFIAIPIKSGMVDLSYTRVVMGDLVIPQVSPFPSYPKDLKEHFEDLQVNITNVAGDVVGSQHLWNPILQNMESLWLAVQAVTISPSAGFFPFFFNDTLFIKIFSGGVLYEPDYVPDPSGQSVAVFYRLSDGAAGNLKQNQLKKFGASILTEDGHEVSVTVYNNEALNGVNPPSRAELVNLLRKRFYASSHVSSLPEYTTWFLAQPQVGDCLVMSDFERWVLSGKATTKGFSITGAVDVYLLDQNGVPVQPKESPSSGYSSFVQELNSKLVKDMDVAFIKYEAPRLYWHFFVVQFRDVYSESVFQDNVVDALRNLYSLKWVRSNNLSLFRGLDTGFISDIIRSSSAVSGLRIIPYHYNEFYYDSLLRRDFVILQTYNGEKAGGWYEFYEHMTEEDEFGSVPHSVYKEFVDVSGDCLIYQYNVKKIHNADGSDGWVWSSLVKEEGVPVSVGRRVGNEVRFNVLGLPSGVLRCFWAVSNEGSISVGNSPDSGFGIRALPSDEIALEDVSVPNDGTKTFFGEFIRFEKYNEA